MKGDPYSPYKVVHQQGKLATLRWGSQIVPTQVQLILSDLCNQDCNFCAYRLSGNVSNALFNGVKSDGTPTHNPNRMIPYEKAVEILDDCLHMGVEAIQFTGGGEPLVHPRAVELMDYAQEAGLGIALVTNGTLLDRTGTIQVVAKADWVRVSLDAGDDVTYARVRMSTPGTMQRVLDNIRALVAERNRIASKTIIGVGFVVTPDNWLEVVTAAYLARSTGADNFRISAAFTPEDEALYEGIYEQAAALCRKAVEVVSTPEFNVFNLFGDRISDLRQHAPDYSFCGYQQFTTYIGGDLNVYRCCVQSYNPRGLIGSLKEQSFAELWVSDGKRKDFLNFDARGCSRCQFNTKNRFINYCLDKDAEHTAYV